VKPIFTNNCGPCHIDAAANGGSSGLNLASQFAFAELVGVDSAECLGANARKRVKADAPSESYLMHKTRGILLCSGSRMPPPPSAALTASQLATIGRWICQGAKNN
jgi:mono/diheme cytochrome c family protein